MSRTTLTKFLTILDELEDLRVSILIDNTLPDVDEDLNDAITDLYWVYKELLYT